MKFFVKNMEFLYGYPPKRHLYQRDRSLKHEYFGDRLQRSRPKLELSPVLLLHPRVYGHQGRGMAAHRRANGAHDPRQYLPRAGGAGL